MSLFYFDIQETKFVGQRNIILRLSFRTISTLFVNTERRGELSTLRSSPEMISEMFETLEDDSLMTGIVLHESGIGCPVLKFCLKSKYFLSFLFVYFYCLYLLSIKFPELPLCRVSFKNKLV